MMSMYVSCLSKTIKIYVIVTTCTTDNALSHKYDIVVWLSALPMVQDLPVVPLFLPCNGCINITVLSIFSSVAKCCEDSIFNYSSREKVLSPVIHSYTLIIPKIHVIKMLCKQIPL